MKRKFLFICGVARSGTSALWRLVSSHPKVGIGIERFITRANSADFIGPELFEKERFFTLKPGDTFYKELRSFNPRYAEIEQRYDSCLYVGDKVPRLYEHYERLWNTFDSPKIVFIVRNIVEVANSYQRRVEKGTNWGRSRDYQASVIEWNRALMETRRHLQAKSIYVVEFESAFSGESQARKMFDYLELDWTPEVAADFAASGRKAQLLAAERETNFGLGSKEVRHLCLTADFSAYRALLQEAESLGQLAGVTAGDGQVAAPQSTSEVPASPSAKAPASPSAKAPASPSAKAWGKYQEKDLPFVDYSPYELKDTGRIFRGPASQALDDGRYVACIGGAQTFGRYVERPYPVLLQDASGVPFLNLGYGGGKPALYLHGKGLLDYLNRAAAVVVQVMSARALPNSKVVPAAIDNSFLRDKTAGPEAKPVFADHMYRQLLKELDVPSLRRIIRETRRNYVNQMRELLSQIKPPTILFWFSVRSPAYAEGFDDLARLTGDYPHFVNEEMVEQLRPLADDFVTCVSRQGLPQELVSGTGEKAVNSYYPSPPMHELAAAALSKSQVLQTAFTR